MGSRGVQDRGDLEFLPAEKATQVAVETRWRRPSDGERNPHCLGSRIPGDTFCTKPPRALVDPEQLPQRHRLRSAVVISVVSVFSMDRSRPVYSRSKLSKLVSSHSRSAAWSAVT